MFPSKYCVSKCVIEVSPSVKTKPSAKNLPIFLAMGGDLLAAVPPLDMRPVTLKKGKPMDPPNQGTCKLVRRCSALCPVLFPLCPAYKSSGGYK